MSRLVRYGGYLSWNAIDQFIWIAVPRLLLFPVLLWTMGESAFGSFVLALSFIQMIGNSPGNGLMGYVIRDAIHHTPERQRLMLRTTLSLTLCTTLPLALALCLGAGVVAHHWGDASLRTSLPMLTIFLVGLNLTEVALTIYRVRRQFGRVVFIHTLETAVFFSAIPLIAFGFTQGAAIGYALGAVLAFGAVLWLQRDVYFARPLYDHGLGRAALSVWLPFSLGAFLQSSAGQVDRIVLGYYWKPEDVTVFFTAAATARIVLVPGAQSSQFLLSMLGRVRQSDRFSRRFYGVYAFGLCLFAVGLWFVADLCGNWILSVLYPSVREKALPLWTYVVGAYAALNVHAGCRPFINKFLHPRILPLMAMVSLVIRFVPLLILVPLRGAAGAALAMLIGALATATLWLIVYLVHFVFSRNVHSSQIARDEDDSVDTA